MSPVLRDGDLILVVPRSSDTIRRGDIVQVYHEHQVVTHRLLESKGSAGSKSATTKGDRSLVPDQVWVLSSIVGRIESVERDAKTLVITGNRWHIWIGRVVLLEWRYLSAFENESVRRIVHHLSLLVVWCLAKLAWITASTPVGRG
jgi:signal peptidase I